MGGAAVMKTANDCLLTADEVYNSSLGLCEIVSVYPNKVNIHELFVH